MKGPPKSSHTPTASSSDNIEEVMVEAPSREKMNSTSPIRIDDGIAGEPDNASEAFAPSLAGAVPVEDKTSDAGENYIVTTGMNTQRKRT